MNEVKLINSTRVALADDDITPMGQRDTDAMIGVGRRWWKFRGVEIDKGAWEAEWRSDGKVYLHDDAGNVVEGIELSDAETEQLARETLLADLLELAVGKLRSGDGWDEGTTGDVFREILHCYPSSVKKALGLARLSGIL